MKNLLKKSFYLLMTTLTLSTVIGCSSPTSTSNKDKDSTTASSGSAQDTPSDADDTTDKVTLKIGSNIGNIPFEFKEGDNLVGFEIDLLNKIAEVNDWELEYTNTPFNGLFTGLYGGKFDVIMSSITVTAERSAKVDFTQPYVDSSVALTTRKESNIKAFEDLKGKSVAVEGGTTPEKWANENKDIYGFEVKVYDAYAMQMLDVEGGRVDATIGDTCTARYYITTKPDLEVPLTIDTNEKFALGFAKDSPYRDIANDTISAFKQDGTMDEIYQKWFGTDATGSGKEVLDVMTFE